MEHHKAKLSNHLARFFPGYALREDEDFFQTGFVSSLFAIQLVNFVEHEFDLSVENEDLKLDNFHTINALCGFIERKLAERRT
jgi:acyl carrier protein